MDATPRLPLRQQCSLLSLMKSRQGGVLKQARRVRCSCLGRENCQVFQHGGQRTITTGRDPHTIRILYELYVYLAKSSGVLGRGKFLFCHISRSKQDRYLQSGNLFSERRIHDPRQGNHDSASPVPCPSDVVTSPC